MSTNSFKSNIENGILDLVWSLWSELGVRGVQRNHSKWAIDLEALIAFTAALGDLDPRLRDETTDWCIEHNRWISGSRLKKIIKDDYAENPKIGEFIATVNEHSQARLPCGTKSRKFKSREHSLTIDFGSPALVVLRIRGMVGVGARAEVIFNFIASPSAQYSASDLAQKSYFTKRRVADTLHELSESGLLRSRKKGNQLIYSFQHWQTFTVLLGTLPSIYLSWSAVFPYLLVILKAASNESSTGSLKTFTELKKLNEHRPIDVVLPPPPLEHKGKNFWPAFTGWAEDLIGPLSSGAIDSELSLCAG